MVFQVQAPHSISSCLLCDLNLFSAQSIAHIPLKMSGILLMSFISFLFIDEPTFPGDQQQGDHKGQYISYQIRLNRVRLGPGEGWHLSVSPTLLRSYPPGQVRRKEKPRHYISRRHQLDLISNTRPSRFVILSASFGAARCPARDPSLRSG